LLLLRPEVRSGGGQDGEQQREWRSDSHEGPFPAIGDDRETPSVLRGPVRPYLLIGYEAWRICSIHFRFAR
jgi:hypothetical protein